MKRKSQATPLAEIHRRAERVSRWVEYVVCGLILFCAAAMIAVAVVGLVTWPELPR